MKKLLLLLFPILLIGCTNGGNPQTNITYEESMTDVADTAIVSIKEVENKIDSATIQKLKPFFNVQKDEFSKDNLTWYTPKSAPKYANANGIYCYFSTVNNNPENFRLKLQYYADDWLFFYSVQFSIEDKSYEYIPYSVDRDCGDGGYIWEWSDDKVSETNKDLIIALSNASNAKMKLIGKQYFDIKTITKKQCEDIKKTLDLYIAMGGQF